MEPMSYVKARAVVASYNKTRCARSVARELQLKYQDCLDFVNWLWHRTFATHESLIKRIPGNQTALPELPKIVWIEYLYSRDVTPEAVANSVGWHVNEVLRTCKGPSQWRRIKNRQPVGRQKANPDDNGPSEDEIPVDEIYRRAQEIRLQRPESQQEHKPDRVETPHFSFKR